jgi:hypothetical protein
MTANELIRGKKTEFLDFFHSTFPVFHLSNVFYLDIKYALKYYFIMNHFRVSEAELEPVTEALINEMVSEGILKTVSSGTWTLNYPEFGTKKPGKPILQQ